VGRLGQLGFEAPGRGVGCEAGLRASWATVLSCELGRGRGLAGLGRPKLGEVKETLQIFFSKEYKQLNSNTGLNSANQKIVLQHECNNKLLWFIDLIKRNN
jgi:hypothetical protein